MSEKISLNEFIKRFESRHPSAKYTIEQYSAISKECIIRCNKCGKVYTRARARDFLGNHFCTEENVIEQKRIQLLLKDSDFEFVKITKDGQYILSHRNCGAQSKYKLSTILNQSCVCCNCNGLYNFSLDSLNDIKKTVGGQYQVLEYCGLEKRNKIKCLKCGFIFSTKLNKKCVCPHCKY